MPSKREILIEICEHPGWEPPEVSGVDQWVKQLHDEGWIQPRLDGWEASPKALDQYPRFEGQEDISDPTVVRVIKDASGEKGDVDIAKGVPVSRVEILLVGMLRQMPVSEVYALTFAPATVFPAGGPEWEIAHKIAERLAEWQQ